MKILVGKKIYYTNNVLQQTLLNEWYLAINLNNNKLIEFSLNGIAGTGTNTTTSIKNIRKIFAQHNIEEINYPTVTFLKTPIDYLGKRTKTYLNSFISLGNL